MLSDHFENLGRSLPFRSFRYVYPPRIENALPLEDLAKQDPSEYFAQPKLNGDCVVIFTNGQEFEIWDRSAQPYGKAAKISFDPNLLHRTECPGERKWFAVVGEFMAKGQRDSLGRDTNGQFIIFDLLVFDGVHLTGTTFEERRVLLDNLYGTEVGYEEFLHSTTVPGVHRVRTYFDGFIETWDRISPIHMIEGLVLKCKDGLLGDGNQNASAYSLKFRKPTKNYTY